MNTGRDSSRLTLQEAEAALRWWSEAGVDLALDETPHDRFAESALPPPRRAAAAAPPAPARPPEPRRPQPA